MRRLLLFLLLAATSSFAAERKPNIVLMLVDDLGATDVGCFGSKFYETPNIDRLARDGMRFTQAYSACTVCSPSRAALMSGRSPAALHITDWIAGHNRPYAKLKIPDWLMEFPAEQETIATALHRVGYVSAHIGKWHLGQQPATTHGFDVTIADNGKGQPASYLVPYKNPNNYVKLSGRLAEQLAKTEKNGAIWANQFDNTANRDAHVQTTAKEIWEQTQGRIDGFTCAVGSGGTLGGVAIGLKTYNPNIRIAAADPMGAAIYSWIKTGELHMEGSSITEGIGQGRVTANLEGAPIDDAFQIPDEEALPIIFDLLEHEGLCMGGSTGINIAGAIRMAKQMGPGHTIVTVLCDYGTRYQSKLFNPEFLRSKNLPVPHWLVDKREAIKVPYES